MDPDQIIKYVNLHYESYWSVDRSMTRAAMADVLKPWLGSLSDSAYSRLRRAGKTPKKLRDVLAHPQALAEIESALACPGLFSCRHEDDVDALMLRQVGASTLPARVDAVDSALISPTATELDDVPASTLESEMATTLAGLILRHTQPRYLACWADPPAIGAAFVAYAVAASPSLRRAGTTAYLAQPYSSLCTAYLEGSDADKETAPFDQSLRDLAHRLGLPESPSPRALLDRLLETNGVLFILNADTLESQARGRPSAMHRLLMEAKERTARRAAKCIPLVLVGVPSDEKITKRTERLHGPPGRTIQFGAESAQARSEFFERQWRRYCRLRGIQLDAEAGSSRLKRVRQYYLSEAGAEAWPATLRLSAFFASNYQTFGYFDPTAGWTRMVGLPVSELPLDVRLHLGEVITRLRAVDEDKKRWATLRAMQWCSTAVYWLSSGAVQDLGKKLTPRTEPATFHAAVVKEDGLVDIVPVDEKRSVYKMELAARAAIQDRWARKDPRRRACAHHLVAQRLYQSRDNEALLKEEFPFEPHWGSSRVHILAECIRHLIRTCEQVPRNELLKRQLLDIGNQFPDAPAETALGCDPYQVLNFCFGGLYWRELNRNGRSRHQTTRKLALQYGAYHLTAELLQLMSDGQVLGTPHWALGEQYVTRYLREVGFAQLDLGDLKGAKATFESLIARAAADSQDPLDIVDYKLDLTVVLSSMDDLDMAKAVLKDATKQLETATQLQRQDDGKIAQQIRTRIQARHAHIAYLSGAYDEALAYCQSVEETSPAALVRDVAHTYISTLGALGDRRSLELAIKVCVRQLFHNTSRKLHHEALGFRVALGHLFRKLDFFEAAEAALDGAYEDILQHGCAERTYLAMLLEAGRVLHHQGRSVRAYAAYLRPCLDRASSRGYKRTAAHAQEYARKCLERMIENVPEHGWSQEQIERELAGRGDYLQTKRSKKIDPRYSYDPVAIERWLPRLQDRCGLEGELRAVVALANSSSDQRLVPLSELSGQ